MPRPASGGATPGYSGHRPREAIEDGGLSHYSGRLGQLTPWRRHYKPIATKVGVDAKDAWVPQTSTSHSSAPPKPAATTKGRRAAWSVNDWEVHQPERPPPLPETSGQWRRSVGGVAAGYAGFVPLSAEHCGSSHVGMRECWAGERAQRGHVGKSASGVLMRHTAEPPIASRLASSGVMGYAGHQPAENLGFGVSGWRSQQGGETDRRAFARATRNEEAALSA
jgi:hypothetical protein